MLGSRAEPIALGPAETPPPVDSPPPGTSADVPEAPVALEGSEALEGEPIAPALEEPAEHTSTPDEVADPDAEPPGADPLTPTAVPATPTPEGVPASPSRDEPGSSEAPGLLEPAAIAEEPPPPARLAAVASGRAAALELPLTRTVVVEPEPAEAPASLLVPELDAPLLVATGEPLDALTVREREVLTLIARGYSNAAIAETFVISEGTVKTHVKRVLAKLGLRDRTQAAIYAYETNFVAARSAVPEPALEPIVLTRVR
jgi:DNA-binding CsgD family transcriptional regulator